MDFYFSENYQCILIYIYKMIAFNCLIPFIKEMIIEKPPNPAWSELKFIWTLMQWGILLKSMYLRFLNMYNLGGELVFKKKKLQYESKSSSEKRKGFLEKLNLRHMKYPCVIGHTEGEVSCCWICTACKGMSMCKMSSPARLVTWDGGPMQIWQVGTVSLVNLIPNIGLCNVPAV